MLNHWSLWNCFHLGVQVHFEKSTDSTSASNPDIGMTSVLSVIGVESTDGRWEVGSVLVFVKNVATDDLLRLLKLSLTLLVGRELSTC